MNEMEQPMGDGVELGLTEQASLEAPADSVESPQSNAPSMYDIDGEQVTADQIKQWKQGHLMQSDYTRKMQELSTQREALKPLEETMSYLRTNPDKAQLLYNTLYGQQEVDPVQARLQQTESLALTRLL